MADDKNAVPVPTVSSHPADNQAVLDHIATHLAHSRSALSKWLTAAEAAGTSEVDKLKYTLAAIEELEVFIVAMSKPSVEKK